MLTYALWYLGIGLAYIFVGVLFDAKKLQESNVNTVLLGAVVVLLFWPIAVLVQVVAVVVAFALWINGLFTKGSK